MIKETFYKDRPAIAVECNAFSALFLPKDGAKLASFKTKDGYELLAQAPGDIYRRLGLDSNYIDCECSAFDDIFPTIDPCVINGMDYIDHGEVCRREHRYIIENNSVRFQCALNNLNISYEKTVYIADDTLCIKYMISNHNCFEFPFVWAGHMMFAGEKGAYVVSDYTVEDETEFMFGKPATLEQAHILEEYGANKEYKYYYTQPKAPIKCGIVYPGMQKQITVEFNNDIVKYLGVWMNPGDLNGMYNLALEPCTALYDNPLKAEKANAASYISAHGKAEFLLKMKYNIIGG